MALELHVVTASWDPCESVRLACCDMKDVKSCSSSAPHFCLVLSTLELDAIIFSEGKRLKLELALNRCFADSSKYDL